MAIRPYDEVGAMGGLFAPAFIYGDPISEAAVARWNAAHLKKPPAPDVNKLPTNSMTDAQRDAIAAALMQNTAPLASIDAGGLGAGGGPYGSDPGAGGTATPEAAPSAAPDTSTVPATPVSIPVDDQSGGSRPSLPEMEGKGLFGGPAKSGSASDQAVIDAQRDADLANADLAAGKEGSRSGAPNLGYNLDGNYGYGVTPAKPGGSTTSTAPAAAPTPTPTPTPPAAPTPEAPPATFGDRFGSAAPPAAPPGQDFAALTDNSISGASAIAQGFAPGITTGAMIASSPVDAPAPATEMSGGPFGGYGIAPSTDTGGWGSTIGEPAGISLGAPGDGTGPFGGLGTQAEGIQPGMGSLGPEGGGWGSIGTSAADAVAQGMAPSDIGGFSSAGGGGYSPQSAANEAAATEAANAAGDVSMGLGPAATSTDVNAAW